MQLQTKLILHMSTAQQCLDDDRSQQRTIPRAAWPLLQSGSHVHTPQTPRPYTFLWDSSLCPQGPEGLKAVCAGSGWCLFLEAGCATSLEFTEGPTLLKAAVLSPRPLFAFGKSSFQDVLKALEGSQRGLWS